MKKIGAIILIAALLVITGAAQEKAEETRKVEPIKLMESQKILLRKVNAEYQKALNDLIVLWAQELKVPVGYRFDLRTMAFVPAPAEKIKTEAEKK